jgi:hypothetical protein
MTGSRRAECAELYSGLPYVDPLTRAIYETNRDITVNALFGWLKK